MNRVQEIITLTAIRNRLCDILHGVEIDQSVGICRNTYRGSFARILKTHYSDTAQFNNCVSFANVWLQKSFVSFGYDRTYPVECRVFEDVDIKPFVKFFIALRYTFHLKVTPSSAPCYYINQKRKFGYGTIHGRFRMALLEKLIEKVDNDIENL